MGKLGKTFGAIILFVVVAVAGLIAFVHFYLTEDRVKSLVIPQAEEALGRKVAIGDIKIGIFSGITIRDFLIKEADSESNFVSTKAFVLSYDLMPLLQKKLLISEIRFDEPTIRIIRDQNGRFNFSSLALLAKEAGQGSAGKRGAGTTALPLALTIDRIHLNRANIQIQDRLKKIPTVDAMTSASLNVALGRSLADLQYKGSYDISADVEHGGAKIRFQGNGTVDQKDFALVLDTDLDGEKIHADAVIKNYFHAPDVTVNINSDFLNVDKLLAMAAGLPETPVSGSSQPPAAKTGNAPTVIADSLPADLQAEGTVRINKAVYKKITSNDLTLFFTLNKGILTVKELSARAYNGKVASDLTVDLNQPGMKYKGNLGLESVQADDLGSALVQKAANMLSGSLQTAMSFSGAGTTWAELQNVLSAEGTFTLVDGGIRGTPVSTSIANLLGLQELNSITYKNISGTFRIVEGGKVKIKTGMQGNDVSAETEGIIGLDGSLDLPLTLHLSPPLADRLRARAAFAKYLTDEQGGASLHMKLVGNLKSPKPTLDLRNAQEQLQKTIQKEIIKKLEGTPGETDGKGSPENILKGLFGR